MNQHLTSPAISIILPVYNRAAYLNRCIQSVIGQTYGDWEIIAIDDGSTDDSLKVLKKFERTNKSIKVFTQQNMKLPLSRNRGIGESKGKFITFIDSDDRYTPNHLEERINFMKKHPEIDLIHGGIQIVGNEYVRDKYNPSQFIHLSDCVVGATFFGKRKVFIELNGFKNISYSEDSEFLSRAEKVFNVETVNFKTYIYHRDAPDSITNSFRP